MKTLFCRKAIIFILCLVTYPKPVGAAEQAIKLTVDWNKTTRVSKTQPTLQVVVNPLLRAGSPIHKRAFQALRELKAEYVRYAFWYPYPRLGVAALEAPQKGETSWNFALIDPLMKDFLEASPNDSNIICFCTIPAWMFKTDYKVYYGTTPDEEVWSYPDGTELRDPTGRELGEYYARLVGWYSKGGFTDETGERRNSGLNYKINYWEVFNEPEFEHQMTPEQYTARYDAIVTEIRKVAPEMKFVGISLAYPAKQPRFFEYFLNPRNHRKGVPLDMISYHFYAQPAGDQPIETHQFTMFEQADKFIDTVRFIESIRQRLAPQTKTTINEVGSILPDDVQQGIVGANYRTDAYWNLSGAMFAYLYANLASMGIDVLGESQLVGFPGQFPSVTMIDWETGKPNARYWVLKLLLDNFRPPVKMVEINLKTPYLHAQAFIDEAGRKKILLINKRDRRFEVEIPGATGGRMERVDAETKSEPPAIEKIGQDKIVLNGFGVAAIELK